jgi:CRISPR system Cascade subunit CasB
MNKGQHPFVEYLGSLRDDRAALAALRRGLGQPPGTVPAMFPYVERYLPDDVKPWQEEAHYLIAALFAYHPDPGGRGNIGDHYADVRRRNPHGDHTALERRFTALLAAHREDLPFYLRQTVSFLKSKEIPIDWDRLFRDVQGWGAESGSVQKRWARAFWGRRAQTETEAKA